MQKTKHWLMTIAMLLCSVAASAYDFTVNNINYNITSYENLEVEVTRSSDPNGYYGTIIIPETVKYNGKTYRVTSIGETSFGYCGRRLYVTIPKSVESIQDYAFYECSLVSIVIPNDSKLTSIGFAAFHECYELTSIEIPTSVTSIGNLAFEDCESLTSVNIPEGLTNIGEYTFSGCSSLTSITIPKSVTSIGSCAFYACSSLTSITIPESVTSIGGSAFANCSSLASITIPVSATSIGYKAFKGTPWYNNMADGVVYLGKVLYAYKGTMPENTTIEVREGTVSFSPSAFRAQSNLTSIIIPKSVTDMAYETFYACRNLKSIICEASVPPLITGELGVDYTISVYVPIASLEDYVNAPYWSEFTNIIGTGLPETTTINLNEYGSGTYCSEYALDFSEVEGLKAYVATGYKTSTGIVTLTRVMTSQPRMGLFLKGEPGEYSVPTLESTDENSLNMLVGTFEYITVGKLSNDGRYANYKYTIGDNGELKFWNYDGGFDLGAGKAYLQIPVEWSPAMEARSIGIRFDNGDGTTDIEDVELNIQNSELIYDLMGRRVTSPQKGELYIIDGKKVIY